MSTKPEEAQAEFALELDRQRQQLLQQAQGSAVGLSQITFLIWPILLLGVAILKKDLSSAEQLIAMASALGLLSLHAAFQFDTTRRTRALLRLLDRNADTHLSAP